MKKINYKIMVAFILGGILTSTVTYAATTLASSNVSYNNTSSKLSSATVQGAIDEIYNTATGGNIVYNNKNIVGAYMYDATTCKTGNEVTCRKTDCPNDTSNNSCSSGTIIKYKVNDNTTKTFHVLHDDISTLTLQQNEKTVSTAWYSESADNTKGPLTALSALEDATSGWNNVNTIEYTMGTIKFNIGNTYTGCDYDEFGCSCMTNTYTLGSRSTKARMITAQEANATGCTYTDNSCSNWMGTGTDYWTMNAYSLYSDRVLYVNTPRDHMDSHITTNNYIGARAVVVISK